ncbi:CDP-diacylglycerol--glycerol-3-phosphate 3-phosphatidyltransferase, mitochondrial [Holothuria leucospilota]|uniref:CDP-diacylglycerol--glycerol-3-phosphate 3-phosphatidyltransferase n=1 Tax=Holothuria leucospilota TaxID=206669 RepID=A0A9Q1C3F3_HOLLE|nr:CDP-diacylglycerol--glycerol-3-phosphate 3-phosphatidyltransferase, mitochondrial [Holothuria leucospilota]
MLLPLLQQFPGRVNVSLYHTPDLRGFLKKLIPERYNEVVSVQHLKVYIFDDTFVTSGANLSDSYFVNRQDRYIRIDGCCELATFYESLVKAICSFSFCLHANNTLSIDQSFGIHPFKGSKKDFQEAARDRVEFVISPKGRTVSKLQHETESSISSTFGNDQMKVRTSVHEATSVSNGDSGVGSNVDHGSDDSETTNISRIDTEGQKSHKCQHASARSFSTKGVSKLGSVNNLESKSNLLTKENNSSSTVSISNRTEEESLGEICHNVEIQKSSISDKMQRTHENGLVVDTWIYPLVQMGPLGIHVDQIVTAGLLQNVEEASKLYLASGYFNLTQQYKDIILRSKGQCEILLASPQVNGFYGASGISGFIPDSYTYIARKFYESLCRRNLKDKMRMHEYYRDGWTFHAKGLWYYLPGQMLPSLTLIGSPNFGHRSVSRDLESQLAVVTTNENLQRQLHKEQEMLYSRAKTVDDETYQKPDRKVPLWVKVVTVVAHNFY